MDLSVTDQNLHKSTRGSKKSHRAADLKRTTRVQSESTVSDAAHTWRGWKAREQPVEESTDISPAEANVVVQEKGTRVNEVGTRANKVGGQGQTRWRQG